MPRRKPITKPRRTSTVRPAGVNPPDGYMKTLDWINRFKKTGGINSRQASMVGKYVISHTHRFNRVPTQVQLQVRFAFLRTRK